MHISDKKSAFLALFMLCSVVLGSAVFAQTTDTTTQNQQTQNEKDQLQQQLQEIENEIARYQQELTQVRGQKNTLQNKINQLKKQQATLKLQIQATSLQISQLTGQITETEFSIQQNTDKGTKLKEQMALFIETISQQDDNSLLSILLAKDSLSDILIELENYSQISEGLHSLLEQTRENNIQLAQAKESLIEQQDGANNLLSIQSIQQSQLVSVVSGQSVLLQQTKGVEQNYQAALSDTQKRAAEIRGRLYQLLGIDTQITFGKAVEIAQWASGQTGVRASFLLAILTQESNLGKNVGTCNRPGDPPEKSWRVVMKPTRDQEPFLQITQDLGMNPDITPVSCPMHDSKGRQVGWGGAMGPAQFIPSTWMGYKDKVSAITGKTANPWDIRDAFLASAIKLKAGGAGTVSGEWAAAMRYFSGGTNTKYRFYGDNVVKMANEYQEDIDDLNK
jgi:membrane-bound lytic murein transglycosylase B